MRSQLWTVILLAVTTTSFAQINSQAATSEKPTSSVTSPEQSRLPVRRVVLYKNGVGYFEHSARIHGDQEVGIDFTTAQLNDVLKSLTVVDLGGGHISSIRYNSIAPLEGRLKCSGRLVGRVRSGRC